MKLWRARFADAYEGTCYRWGTSKRGALVLGRDFAKAQDVHPSEVAVEPVEIGSTRAEIATWLNAHFYQDVE
jgi:hypothetical protein